MENEFETNELQVTQQKFIERYEDILSNKPFEENPEPAKLEPLEKDIKNWWQQQNQEDKDNLASAMKPIAYSDAQIDEADYENLAANRFALLLIDLAEGDARRSPQRDHGSSNDHLGEQAERQAEEPAEEPAVIKEVATSAPPSPHSNSQELHDIGQQSLERESENDAQKFIDQYKDILSENAAGSDGERTGLGNLQEEVKTWWDGKNRQEKDDLLETLKPIVFSDAQIDEADYENLAANRFATFIIDLNDKDEHSLEPPTKKARLDNSDDESSQEKSEDASDAARQRLLGNRRESERYRGL